MSYVYRERDRERDWDEPRSTVSIKRYVIPSEEERERERDFFYRHEDQADRELVIRRTHEREEPVMIQRYEREVDYDSRPLDYRSERDYYEPRGPVYVNPRESDYDIVRRSEVDREPGGYYYHRRVREWDEDRRSRRELSPSDSVSQATRRRDEEDYSSDESMVYIRKETREYDDHPHRRRHLAEGALVGVGAAELLRNHHKKEGEEVPEGVGRLGRDVGAGALGAIAAEAVSRAREHYRSKSRHRSHSFDDDHRSHSRHHRHHRHSHSRRSRSRSHSHSRARTLAELGLGAAAIAGAVALARNKSNSNKDRRSRSRHRRAASSTRSLPLNKDGERSQSKSRKHMAEAGLAGAAVAGLIERARSRSRPGRRDRSRSKSVIRKALPVLAAGLGTAAATGLYEKNKDKREASRNRERRRSRSRSRAPSEVYTDPTKSSPGLIEYGEHPVHGSIPANYYGRPGSSHGYYSDASDPVASGAAGFGSTRRRPYSRSRSRSRGRAARYSSDSSDSESDSRRRQRGGHERHRSRSREFAEAALGAAGVGYAAHKLAQRNERKKTERDRDRSDEEAPYQHDPYPPSPAAPRPIDDHQYYPNTNYFPPPPGSAPRTEPAPYNPADYPPPPGAVPPQPYAHPAHPESDPYAPRPRRVEENVSAAWKTPHHPVAQDHISDGLDARSSLRTPRPKKRRPRAASQPARPKSVAFDLESEHEGQHDPGYETDDSDSTIASIHGHGRNRTPRRRHSSSEPFAACTRSEDRSRKDGAESDSDSTIDLPDRFDSQGRLLPQPGDDPLADGLETLLRGINRVFV
ncbi:uncharacterized protein BO95DRAFT_470649 [Aspergillus brunneoviolaceus CBS 621.78]|uniref:Uncharacterized protein n=1 Tax=Aspergillus brunneoviolaceus CBS 621.78 TaxID=1450534 RepID=A0ACD1GL97_9EURO|nr:hypothetical protein BO95DRAFT_470649 [Aspergillus brunneoviolaceus CBS 621.78]RAH50114.1 hypothetical protein BO95DRAFT_470649 [Aspergillus brunneoviolaceus CBS 621.78]